MKKEEKSKEQKKGLPQVLSEKDKKLATRGQIAV